MPKRTEHKFKFAVIRYIPNFAREEFINAGLILYDMTGQTILGRVLEGNHRLKCFDCEGNYKHFKQYSDDVLTYIDAALQKMRRSRDNVSLADTLHKAFAMATVPSAGLISFSDIKGGLTHDIQQEFEILFEKFVGGKKAESVDKIISHQSVVKSIYEILGDLRNKADFYITPRTFHYKLTDSNFTCEVGLSAYQHPTENYMKVLSLRTKKNYPHEMQNILSSLTVLSDLRKEHSFANFGSLIYFSPKYDQKAQESEFLRLKERFRESNLDCIKATKPDIERYLIDRRFIKAH